VKAMLIGADGTIVKKVEIEEPFDVIKIPREEEKGALRWMDLYPSMMEARTFRRVEDDGTFEPRFRALFASVSVPPGLFEPLQEVIELGLAELRNVAFYLEEA